MNFEIIIVSERSKTKGHRIYDSICMNYPEQANLERERSSGRPEQGGFKGKCGVTAIGHMGLLLGMMKNQF